MAYDKHTWTCNEPITVERLNHIEEGIANAGDCDCGFECTETMTTLTEESVTTAVDPEYPDEAAFVDLVYSQLIDAETIKVTFNGTVYECEKTVDTFGNNNYGAPYDDSIFNYDWSEYPFNINSDSGSISHTALATETAGTYTIKIEALKTNATITPCFEAAVKEANKGMGSIEVPTEASVAVLKRSTRINGSPYAVPTNSSATVRLTFSERLSETATLRRITVPTGILLGKIQPYETYADLDVYNVTANSITLTNDNTSIEFIDFVEPELVCVMMSDGCSSPGPSPK